MALIPQHIPMMRSPLGMHNPMPKMNLQNRPVVPFAPMAPKFAGGGMTSAMDDPWFERREASNVMAYHPGGLYGGTGGGRTDNIANIVPAGAYVIPADVVSGLGEGNTNSGAAIMDKMFHSNPHGIQGSRISSGRGVGIPSAPRPFNENTQYAKGGKAHGHVPIIAASGEFVVHPDALVAKFGDPKKSYKENLDRAHRIMDDFVVHYRKKTAKTMLKLKPPVK